MRKMHSIRRIHTKESIRSSYSTSKIANSADILAMPCSDSNKSPVRPVSNGTCCQETSNSNNSGSNINDPNASANYGTQYAVASNSSSGYSSSNPNGSYSTYSGHNNNSNGNVSDSKVYQNISSSSGIYTGCSNFDIKEENLKSPLVHDEVLAQEVLAKCGPSYTYQRKDYSHDISNHINPPESTLHQDSIDSADYGIGDKQHNQSSSSTNSNCQVNIIKIEAPPIASYQAASVINQDPDPIRIVKPNSQNIVYKQQVNIRYLQPPTPPPPAPIIIREKQLSRQPAQPPIIIRQTAPPPPTPPPLTIREKAPTPPPIIEPTIIERPIPAPPPPPRQVIIERVPAPPAKPRPIIYEKWLPYKSTKRPVIVQKVKQPPPQPPPKNVIIEYEKPKAVAIRQVIEEGIFRVDPATYQSHQATDSNGEIRYVDRITDLPIDGSRLLTQLSLEASAKNPTEPNIYAQYLSSTSTNGFTSSHTSSHTSTNNFYNLSNETEDNNNNNNNNKSTDSNNYYTSSNQYSSSCSSYDPKEQNNSRYFIQQTDNQDQVEYETITTCVPESLAAKIIAEAQAAGAISRSNDYRLCDLINQHRNVDCKEFGNGSNRNSQILSNTSSM